MIVLRLFGYPRGFLKFPSSADPGSNFRVVLILDRPSFAVAPYELFSATEIPRFIRATFVDEKSPYGATANDGLSRIATTWKFEETSRVSEESQTNHRMLPRLLTVKFPVWKQNNLRRKLNKYLDSIVGRRSMESHDFCLSCHRRNFRSGHWSETFYFIEDYQSWPV